MNEPVHTAEDHLVHEAIGRDLTPVQAGAAIGLGVVSLIVAGVLPALLGALEDEMRLSAAGIGLAATLEALTMAISTGLASAFLPPRRLRLIGVVASLLLAALDFAGIGLHENGILAVRTAAGIPEGTLLWITVAMIVRSEVPERWAGVLFMCSTSAQFVLALAFAFWVIPRFGADGGMIALGLSTLPGVAIALFCPERFADLPGSEGGAGIPPLRGLIALLATIVFVAAGAAVAIYLQPLAHEAGLSADVARTAIWVSLGAQIAGSAAATVLAGHLRYLTAFLLTTAVLLGVWFVFSQHVPAWAFIAANTLGGAVSLFIAPFLVPMTIEADPSRKAAAQSAGAQLFATAMGPLFASWFVSDTDVHGALWLGAALLLAGMAMIAGLHLMAVRHGRAEQVA